MNIRMNEEIISLMHHLLEYHDLYENDYESFKSRFDLEIAYWFNFRKLNKMIDKQFESIKPFTNLDHY